MTLGNKIQLLREEHSLSQKELANLVGVTTGTIAEWEADESAPGLAELSRLSKALNVSSDVLLDATVDVIPAPVVTPKEELVSETKPTKKTKKKPVIFCLLAVAAVALVVGAVLLLNAVPFAEDSSAIEKADASVVTIFCYDYDGKLAATGSGFVAFNGKTIITNYHVMTSAYTCKISTNQDISYNVSKILCYSKKQDIAILQLEKDTGLQPLTLGDSSIIKKGETVVAIGSPLGIKNTVSTGVLSGRLMEDGMDVLQFTAPISSGSSGGALFDNNGNVIGITYASYVAGQNLNLAIPIELATNLCKSKGALKKVSAIYFEENPHIAYLEKYPDTPEVTLTDLKLNPQKYNHKVVKLTAYVSSFYQKDLLYVANKNDISGNVTYDQHASSGVDFEDTHLLLCGSWGDCYSTLETVKIGQKIIIIGEFAYNVKGELYWWGGIRENNGANIEVRYIFSD